ncbi:MAG: signal recognition particle-docking protein FtsY [Nitrospinae bacterium]|nr:signal recognition particle-docking protein FtsY [Nitrospinota bacterium]
MIFSKKWNEINPLKRLKEGLAKTRANFISGIERVISGGRKINEELLEELEESLILADLGIHTVSDILDGLREDVKRERITEEIEVKNYLKKGILGILNQVDPRLDTGTTSPFVILVVGVNGSGKTTTIGKLAVKFVNENKEVILAAGDTFRAAAIEQLEIWGERAGVDVIKSKSGADPSAVIFDAVQAIKARKGDILIADTAGRLHTKTNLMEELKKVKRVMDKGLSGAPHEVMLVLDSTTGQNAISQAELFNKNLSITGLVLTKLDGTAKGGVIINIVKELGIPVRYIGVGEGIDDLREFNPTQFVDALFEG